MTPEEKKSLLEATDRGQEAETFITGAEKYIKRKRHQIFELFTLSEADDVEGRERCYRINRALDEILQEATIDVANGKAALAELKKHEDDNDA